MNEDFGCVRSLRVRKGRRMEWCVFLSCGGMGFGCVLLWLQVKVTSNAFRWREEDSIEEKMLLKDVAQWEV